MTAVSNISPTSDSYLNGVLAGVKWGVTNLSFSFPLSASLYGTYSTGEQNNNFEAFNAAQQTAVRAVLQNYSLVSNLTFTEVTESSTVHGELRYAMSDAPSTAWAYYPTTSVVGGDAWFNNSSGYYDNPLKGNYAYLTMLHETGHALGLKHPQDVQGAFAIMPTDKDSIEYTVMSYRSYIGAPITGYTASAYPQTLMMYDILAVQTLYGANYNTNSGDTIYKWDAATGQMSINNVGQGAPVGNKIFMTLWDGGGSDTYDLSNYTTGVKIDLTPGGWTTTSSTQLADLGAGHVAAGNIASALLFQGNTASLIENAIGGSGNDIITGNSANNKLTGKGGNDTIDGGTGSDTAVYSGLFSNYGLAQNGDGSWTITDLRGGSPDGIDILKSIELLQFSDSLQTLGTVAPPPPPPANVVPVITSTFQGAALTEWLDLSASEIANTPHTATGAVTYSDSDAGDVHTASFSAQAAGYVGTFSINTASIESADTVTWNFSVADNAIDYLTAGQTLVQRYDVTIADGKGGTATQTVTVTLVGTADPVANVAPVAVGDSYGTVRNSSLTVAAGSGLLSNDSDANGNTLSATLVNNVSHGKLTFNADGSFVYNPTRNYVGTDTFTYKANDGTANSGIATVTINIGTSQSLKGHGNGSGNDSGNDSVPSMEDDQILPPYSPLDDVQHGNGHIHLVDLDYFVF